MSSVAPTTEPNYEGLGITKEFLQEAMSRKWDSGLCEIENFKLSRGSLVGDGYSTILVTVEIWLKRGKEFLEKFESDWFNETGNNSIKKDFINQNKGKDEPHLTVVVKCFPENVARQEFMEAWDVFTTEVGMYSEIAPAMIQFQENLNTKKIIKPPFLPFISGRSMNVQQMKKLKESRPLRPLDNYLMMLDIRIHGQFKIHDRFVGFDLDHHKLAVEAHAKLHALSWACQYHKKVGDLRSLYPYLQKESMKETRMMLEPLANLHLDIARSVTIHELGGDEEIHKGLDYLREQGNLLDMFDLYTEYDPKFDPNSNQLDVKQEAKKFTKESVLRVSPPEVENEEPWRILLHGDAWSNNIMFRYDPASGKPVQAVLLDLQLSRIGDPVGDLAYTLYTATTREFRSKNLTAMLHVYFDKFVEICTQLSCPTLPNFTWEEFNRRFHRGKAYGLAIGIFGFPIILKNPEYLVDLESVKMPETKKQHEISGEAGSNGEEGKESTDDSNADSKMEKMQELMEMWGMDSDYTKLHPAMKNRLAGLLQDMRYDGIL